MSKSKESRTEKIAFYGTEPDFSNYSTMSETEKSTFIVKSINWYSVMSTDSEKRKWFNEFISKNNFSNEEKEKLKNIKETKIPYGKYEGLLGLDLGIYSKISIEIKETDITNSNNFCFCLKPYIEKILEQKEQKEQTTIKDSPLDRLDNKIREKLSYSEKTIDEILSGKSSSFKQEIKPGHAPKMISWCKEKINEFKQTQTDDEYKDAYSIYKPQNIKNCIKSLEEFEKELQTISESKVIVRKPRKINPIKATKKVKYLKETEDKKLKSILPSKLVGAQKVLIYNYEKKTVSLYEASSPTGISVKGTTLIHFDEKASFTKKIRKPEEFENTISKNPGIRAVKNYLSSVKTTEKEANGRINDKCLILGVY